VLAVRERALGPSDPEVAATLLSWHNSAYPWRDMQKPRPI
jgi:hypothetical protein